MNGTQLKAKRLEKGLSRRALAELCRIHPNTIYYLENRESIHLNGYAIRKIAKALGLTIYRTVTRAREHGVLQSRLNLPEKWSEQTSKTNSQSNTGKFCGAKTRMGMPCKRVKEFGTERCRLHGGLSTGPKTEEGRTRVSIAQKKRWADWRNLQQAKSDNPTG